MKAENLTWEEIKRKAPGIILYDEVDEGIRFIIMRGPCSLCAYIGIPETHPLANKDYTLLPVPAHGGLTFGASGKGWLPIDYFWYGWDYGHCDDYTFYDDTLPVFDKSSAKKWLVKDVLDDSWEAMYQFKKLMKLAEVIANET